MSNIDSDSSKKILFLDVGNSSIKGAYRDGVNWENIHHEGSFSASDLLKWIENHPEKFHKVVVAGVQKEVIQAIKSTLTNVTLAELTMRDVPRELLDYRTTKTLGVDRFLACYGATKQTSKSVVVIDAGTAVTIDFMDQDDVFRGGVIAPGLSHFMQILPKVAPALPEVDVSLPKNWPGKSTKESLKWGQSGFYKLAIENMLHLYENEFGAFDLFITGGNGGTIQKLIQREAKLRPFLVFDGMQRLFKNRL